MKSRLEAEIAEKKNDKTNPFAQPEVVVTETEEELPKLAEEYAIMEIRGKGENLTAKLINKGGDSFMVRNGTVCRPATGLTKSLRPMSVLKSTA